MRKRPMLTLVLLASLLLSTTGAQAAVPASPGPGESPQTAIDWAPGAQVTFPTTGPLWLAVPLEAGRSVGFAVPEATGIALMTTNKRYMGSACAIAGDLTCTFMPTGTGTYLLRLTGPAGADSTPVLMDGKAATSAYQLGNTKNQRWALPVDGSGWWAVQGRPVDSIWAFSVPGAAKLTLWDGTTKLQEADGPSLRFKATAATKLTLEVKAPRAGYYSPSLWAEGGSAASGFDWDVSSAKSVTIGTSRTTWVLPTGLLPGRTTQLFIEGEATLATQTTQGRYLLTSCVRTTTGQQCRLVAPEGESVALRLGGAPGTSVKLTAKAGTTTSPYLVPQLDRPERPFQIEQEGTAVLSFDLPTEPELSFKVPGATGLKLAQGATTVATSNGEWLTAKNVTAGNFQLEVTAGQPGIIQVQRYLPGELPDLAVEFDPAAAPFKVRIGARKTAWVKVSGLKALQTFQFLSPVPLYPATLDGAFLTGIRALRPNGQSLAFTPTADGDYLIRLSGEPGITTLSLNGLSETTPLGPVSEVGSRVSIPAGTTAWITLAIPAAGRWGISVPGATTLTLTQGATQVGTATADWLTVDAPASGTYTLAIKAGKTGGYVPTLVPNGGARQLTLPLPAAGTTASVASNKSLWLEAAALPAGRYTVKFTRNPAVIFSDANKQTLRATCGTAGTLRICNVTVPADGKLWVQVLSAPGLAIKVTLQKEP